MLNYITNFFKVIHKLKISIVVTYFTSLALKKAGPDQIEVSSSALSIESQNLFENRKRKSDKQKSLRKYGRQNSHVVLRVFL